MKNKKGKKGELLVETIVAMAICGLMTVSVFGVFKTFSSIGKRELEYIHFETVCLDIDKYYDAFGKEMWDEEYFGRDMYLVKINEAGETAYVEEYDEEYKPLNMLLDPMLDVGYTYELTYRYEGDDLVLNIVNVDTGRNIITDLHYGPTRASDIGEYYEQVQAMNPLYYEVEDDD